MKAYNKYMDKISVSDSLHRRIMSCTDNTRPKRQSIMIKYYIAVSACFAMVLLGVFTLPKNNVMPAPGNTPSALQPGSNSSIHKYNLNFNKVDAQAPADIAIKEHFGQQLNSNEIKAIFPSLGNTHIIKATANFQSNKGVATLFNIDANAKSISGLETYIQIAPSEIVLDYVFESETKSSDVLGTAVTAGYFETKSNSKGVMNIIYFATFKLSDVAYYVELGGIEAEKEILKNEISQIIGILIEGGTADIDVFHPVVPGIREDRLNLDEAYADIDFGAYLPRVLPDEFVFEDALRFINQEQNTLYVNWTKGIGYINWRVSTLDDNDKMRITSVSDIKNYDLTLYPIPRADSVPNELSEIVDDPIFRIDELTIDAVKGRTYEVADAGDNPGPRMRFGVLYGDTLVEVSIKDVSPEVIFEILQQIKK